MVRPLWCASTERHQVGLLVHHHNMELSELSVSRWRHRQCCGLTSPGPPGLILSSDYCLCEVSHVLQFPPKKNMAVRALATLALGLCAEHCQARIDSGFTTALTGTKHWIQMKE